MSRSGMAIEEIAECLGIDEDLVMEALEDEFDKSLTMAGLEYIGRMDLPPSWNEYPFYPNQEIVANAYEQGKVDDHNDVWKDAHGDYLPDYDCELWGEEVTFDELAQMVGQLVIVNDSWYPEDELEEDGEGDVLLVTDADGDIVHLRGDTPKIYEITRLAMDDSVKTRYCTKVWKVKGSEAADMIEETKSTVIVLCFGFNIGAMVAVHKFICNLITVTKMLKGCHK
jgi:hypothetical protein